MKFDVKIVHEFLKTNGIVYTVRGYEQNENYTVVQVNNVGHCMKSKVCKIESVKDLIPYVNQSGFKTAEAWHDQFKLFGHTEGWLYRVEYLNPAEEFKPVEMDIIKDLATQQWQEKIHEDYAMEGELS